MSLTQTITLSESLPDLLLAVSGYMCSLPRHFHFYLTADYIDVYVDDPTLNPGIIDTISGGNNVCEVHIKELDGKIILKEIAEYYETIRSTVFDLSSPTCLDELLTEIQNMYTRRIIYSQPPSILCE